MIIADPTETQSGLHHAHCDSRQLPMSFKFVLRHHHICWYHSNLQEQQFARRLLADFACSPCSILPVLVQQYYRGKGKWEYMPVAAFAKAFQQTQIAQKTRGDLAQPYQAPNPKCEEALIQHRYALNGEMTGQNIQQPQLLRVCLYICLSVCLSVCPSVCLIACLPACLPACLLMNVH